MLSNASRSFLPESNNTTNTPGPNVALTYEERCLVAYGKDNTIEFFDAKRNRDIRAIMGANRAPFLS